MMVKPHYSQGNDNKPVLTGAESDYHPDEAGENGFGHRPAEVTFERQDNINELGL